MSKAVIIRKSASELRVGDRIMETDGGGLWYHIATVESVTLSLVADRRVATSDPKDATMVNVNHVRSSALFNVEVIV